VRKLGIGALTLAFLLSACGNSGTAETTTSAATTTPVTEATTTTTEPTTTTTEPTTTTIPRMNVKVEVNVYDDWVTASTNAAKARAADLQTNEPCTINQMGFINSDAQIILKDANIRETLAIGQLGSGSLAFEDIPPSVPPSDEALFWVCTFEATLDEVPLDRDFYTLQVAGDHNADRAITYELAWMREGFVSMSFFFLPSEAIRDPYRG
jgi:hypothetical protein